MEHWHRSGQALLNEISSTRLPASQLAIWSIGQCGFIFKYEGTVVCIDPVLSDLTGPSGSRRCYPAPFAPEALGADLVLCTHGHADHMAKDTLRGLARHPAARFVLPAGCSALAAEYGIPADRITTVQEGSILPLGGVTVRAFSAAHPEHILDAGDPGMALGYQLTFGGFTVVHLGDTYLTPHLYETLQALPRPDLLLAPINGQDFFRTQRNCIGNLEAEEAALQQHGALDLVGIHDLQGALGRDGIGVPVRGDQLIHGAVGADAPPAAAGAHLAVGFRPGDALN